ncbi:acyl carrier protein [Methylobacterium sp. NEAU 140]|uniref:acyl carrier protein n=1 Tax=Methylobacterium sp. NEAU 140 TaxID=3064945 RepID=UPI0027376EDA|nr:acyl carrier protein [Methylobacterium sp. NEAU 140]MDP4022650.1 acyl carrier protein [Methylobacterium sp. NEAU 140]
MTLRHTIVDAIETIAREQDKPMPPVTDDLVMVDTEFDSLCFALLVARMEDMTGVDPFSDMEVADLPVTVGDLVALYDRAVQKRAA